MKIKKNQKRFKEVVLQSNDITNSSTAEFSKMELNCFLFILSKLKEDVYDYNISTLDLMKFLKIETKRTNRVIESMDKLLANSLHIPQENGRVLAVTILQHFEYHKEQNVSSDNYISFKVADRIRPYLFNLQEKFTVLNIAESLSLKKKNSYILYTFLRQWKESKKVKIELFLLRDCFDSKQVDTGGFIKKVIEPAIIDIEDNTSIKNIEVEKIKNGRIITHLIFRFKILTKLQMKKMVQSDVITNKYNKFNDLERNMFNRLNSEFGVSEDNSLWIIETCIENTLMDKLKVYLHKVYIKNKEGEIDFVTKYVLDGIKENLLGIKKN